MSKKIETLSELIDDIRPKLPGMIQLRFPRFTWEDCEDVAQEVCISIANSDSWENFRENPHYIRRIAQQKAIDLTRRRRARKRDEGKLVSIDNDNSYYQPTSYNLNPADFWVLVGDHQFPASHFKRAKSRCNDKQRIVLGAIQESIEKYGYAVAGRELRDLFSEKGCCELMEGSVFTEEDLLKRISQRKSEVMEILATIHPFYPGHNAN